MQSEAMAPASATEVHSERLAGHMTFSSRDPLGKKNANKRPLAVIVAWMRAKDQHIDKFRSLYLERGFDVLAVTTSATDLLFPVSGCQAIATDVLEYLRTHAEYRDVVFHAFSVGGYLMGELFVKIRDGGDQYRDVPGRIRGVVTDSAIDFEGIPTGFPRAVTGNPFLRKLLEWYIAVHLALMFSVATKHYLRSSKNFHNTPLRCPALMFVSEADEVGSPAQNQLVMENWVIRGNPVEFKCFKDSKHVSHLYQYPEEYVSTLDGFLARIDMLPKSAHRTNSRL